LNPEALDFGEFKPNSPKLLYIYNPFFNYFEITSFIFGFARNVKGKSKMKPASMKLNHSKLD